MNIATRNETFEAWRERNYDDLCLSLAFCVWYGERYGGPPDDYVPQHIVPLCPYGQPSDVTRWGTPR